MNIDVSMPLFKTVALSYFSPLSIYSTVFKKYSMKKIPYQVNRSIIVYISIQTNSLHLMFKKVYDRILQAFLEIGKRLW